MSRQLDAAIAEALGKTIYEWQRITNNTVEWGNDLPEYSTDGNAMLELDREMRERGWDYINTHYSNIGDRSKFYTEMRICDPTCPDQNWYKKTGLICADTEPLARALAAYKVLTGKRWEGEGE